MKDLIEGLSKEGLEFERYLNLKSKPIMYDNVSRESYTKFMNFYSSCKKRHIIMKGPDIIIFNENKTIGLEYFEIDSSPTKKQKKDKQSSETKDLINEIRDEIKKSEITIGKSSNVPKKSLYDYVKNYNSQFKKHINKINLYEENIKDIEDIKKGNKIEYGFVINNTSLRPDFVRYNGKYNVITPLNIQSIFNSLINEERISYIFYLAKNPNNELLTYFFVLRNKNIEKNIKPIIEFYDECELFETANFVGAVKFVMNLGVEAQGTIHKDKEKT